MTEGLRLHNTLTGESEPFRPIYKTHVRMYVCGPTVYDDIHIGNARPLVVFDVLYRLLKKLHRRVTYVRNITDVDDKILARSQESGEPIDALTKRTAEDFERVADALGCLAPDFEPRATEHIDEMIRLAKKLIARGHAYEADGHVLFHVPSDPDYGRLSGRSRDEMVAGARVEVATYKRDPADFVLWKPSNENEPGWDSPWGRGRPGWHIECSAMSEKYLGRDFDIHGGGQDLIFPHHENEIAQSTCAHGSGFAHFWVHNGYLKSEGQKMSKSLGNFYTVRELLETFPGEALRLVLLETHYRQPLDFSKRKTEEARKTLEKLYKPLWDAQKDGALARPARRVPLQIMAALEDDLNTPMALTRLRELASDLNMANQMRRRPQQLRLSGQIRAAGVLLGLLRSNPRAWFQDSATEILAPSDIDSRIEARNHARKSKDYEEADEIRNTLAADGIILEDGRDGTSWERLVVNPNLDVIEETLTEYIKENWQRISQTVPEWPWEGDWLSMNGETLEFDSLKRDRENEIIDRIVEVYGERSISAKEIRDNLRRVSMEDFVRFDVLRSMNLFFYRLNQQLGEALEISIPVSAIQLSGIESFRVGVVTFERTEHVNKRFQEAFDSVEFRKGGFEISSSREIGRNINNFYFGEICATTESRVSDGLARDKAVSDTNVALSLIRLIYQRGEWVRRPGPGSLEPAPGLDLYHLSNTLLTRRSRWKVSHQLAFMSYVVDDSDRRLWEKDSWQEIADTIYQRKKARVSSVVYSALEQWAVARQQDGKYTRYIQHWQVIESLLGWLVSGGENSIEDAAAWLVSDSVEEQRDMRSTFESFRKLADQAKFETFTVISENRLKNLEGWIIELVHRLCVPEILMLPLGDFRRAYGSNSETIRDKLRRPVEVLER